MARTIDEFAKVELRLLNDYRFFTLSEFEKLTYILLILIAKLTNNEIPKKIDVIMAYMRVNRSPGEVKSVINRLHKVFPKFKQNKYFHYFDDFQKRHALQGQRREEKIREEKIREEKKGLNLDPTKGTSPKGLSTALQGIMAKAKERGGDDKVTTEKR